MNKPFKGLDKKLKASITGKEQMERFCIEYKRNPAVGDIIWAVTKGHPCNSCNRPADCRTKIRK